MKSEMRLALDTCMEQLLAATSNDAADKALTIVKGLVDSMDRTAAALERIAASLEKIEPVV